MFIAIDRPEGGGLAPRNLLPLPTATISGVCRRLGDAEGACHASMGAAPFRWSRGQ